MPVGTDARVDSSRSGIDARHSSPIPLPTGQLLRSGGSGIPAPSTDVLRNEAARILAGRPGGPPGIRGPAFAREVERYRRHLAPIVIAELLEASFGREAFQRIGRRPHLRGRSPLRVAYAVRWIELKTDIDLPPWSLWSEESALACTAVP
jgi:hypothetical protein